jgi:hypothetical protein
MFDIFNSVYLVSCVVLFNKKLQLKSVFHTQVSFSTEIALAIVSILHETHKKYPEKTT